MLEDILGLLTAQHVELTKMSDALFSELVVDKLKADAKPAHALSLQIIGRLGMHMALEDKSLYPTLLKHDDPALRAAAAKYLDERAHIVSATQRYYAAWRSPRAVQGDPLEFVRHSKETVKMLSERMRREDDELHPLIARAKL